MSRHTQSGPKQKRRINKVPFKIILKKVDLNDPMAFECAHNHFLLERCRDEPRLSDPV